MPRGNASAPLLEALTLLKEQAKESPEAIRSLRALKNSLSRELESGSTKQQPGLFDLHTVLSEWEGMFSYVPGRVEGLPSIIRLVESLRKPPSKKDRDLYQHPEWKALVDLRGPVDEVCEAECGKCSSRYYLMIMSGFLEMTGFVSYPSGDAVLRSIHDDSPLPKPESGTPYKNGCPECGGKSPRVVRSISPYQYFATRKFRVL